MFNIFARASLRNGTWGMNLTGNPFVDVGLGIAASKAGRTSVKDLSREDLHHGVHYLHASIQKLRNLKILASFWVNNPFMGKNLGQMPKFERYLQDLEAGHLPAKAGYCQICGQSPVINEVAAGCQADRCWFPLAGSGDSDPCTLPGLRSKAVCAACLAAVVVLPLGCRSCPDGPYFIHITEPDLQVQAVSEASAALGAALSVNARDGITHGTALRGRVALLDIVSGSRLWDHSQPGHITRLPQQGAAIISFNNNGQGACFNELYLPAQALEFFGAIAEAGVRRVFVGWVEEIQRRFRKESALYFEQLCDFITAAQIDWLGVFSYSDEEGAAAFGLDAALKVPKRAIEAQAIGTIATTATGFARNAASSSKAAAGNPRHESVSSSQK